MDEKWQDWHDSTLCPLLRHAPGEEPSPELKNLLARDPTQVDLALLAADTDRTQDYVFESARLPEIRGASRHLDDLNKSLRVMVRDRGGHPIVSEGGQLLALIHPSIAQDLVAEIEALYPDRTVVATITADWRRVTPEMVIKGYPSDAKAPFGNLIGWAGTWLRRRKESRSTAPFVEALPYEERCRSCLTRPASPHHLPTYPDWPLCDVCHDKRAYRGRDMWFRWFQKHLDEHQSQKQHYYGGQPAFPRFDEEHDQARWTPQDLGEIGEACVTRPGYVGFIYLDGDGMGRLFEKIPTPHAYATVGEAVGQAAKEAVMEALATNLHPAWVRPSAARGRGEKPGSGDLDKHGRMRIHPFEIITVGGDDIMLITPADAALPIAAAISQAFQEGVRRKLSSTYLPQKLKTGPYTMSGGVVLASDHNPVRVLRDLAKELQAEAKRARREAKADEGYIDFLTLKSVDMLESDVREARQLYPYKIDIPGTNALRLLGCPYPASVLARLWQDLGELRIRDGGFPTSQMRLLAEALLRGRQESSLFYLYQQARGKKEHFARLNQVLETANGSDAPQHPIPWFDLSITQDKRYEWLKGRYSFQTALWDVAELYDFVPIGR
jgi:hypothetical protein